MIGSPASWSVDSCRVKLVSTFDFTPPMEIDISLRFLIGVVVGVSPAFWRSWISLMLVGKRPNERIFTTASSGLEASILSFTVCPLLSTALYLKMDISNYPLSHLVSYEKYL